MQIICWKSYLWGANNLPRSSTSIIITILRHICIGSNILNFIYLVCIWPHAWPQPNHECALKFIWLIFTNRPPTATEADLRPRVKQPFWMNGAERTFTHACFPIVTRQLLRYIVAIFGQKAHRLSASVAHSWGDDKGNLNLLKARNDFKQHISKSEKLNWRI